jgi:PAS domain S-box-containing protein
MGPYQNPRKARPVHRFRMFALVSDRVVESGKLVQIVFDSLAERICVLDRGGAIVLTNQAWDRFAGANGGDPTRCGVGVNYLEICRIASGPFSEGALEAASGIEGVMRGATQQFTLDYPCPSPSRKAWFRLFARPLRRPHIGVVVLHTEITSQVLLAVKLRRTQANYGALWENPVSVATVLATDGNVRYQSPASEGVLGLKPVDLVGHPILEFVHPDDVDTVRTLLRECLRYPRLKHPCEYRFRGKDGSWRTLESVASNLLSHPWGGIVLNSRDISRQKAAEQSRIAEQAALVRGREELEVLTARLLRRQEDERRQVAGELNGSLAQRLASMSIQAANLSARAAGGEPWHVLQGSIASLETELRHVSGGLYPAVLDHLGLGVALRECCTEFSRKHGVSVNYIHRGVAAHLPAPIASALYRVAEGALCNVARHAHANHAWVTLSRIAKGIRLTIRDDGAGFDPAAVEPGAGLGLLVMRERLRGLQGSLSIRSRQGCGTEVVAVVPQ